MFHKSGAFILAPLFICAAAFAADVRTVRSVTDGDTLVLDDGRRVRLIGVDTPEMSNASRNSSSARRNKLDERTVQSFAKQAKAFLKTTVEGRAVRVEYDQEKTDKYGRTLAYVYRKEDGLFVNAEIVRQGYGFAYTRFPFRFLDEFRALQKEARNESRGLWKT
jgi:micrococcal nuclease